MKFFWVFDKRKEEKKKNENELKKQELLNSEVNHTYEVLCKAKSEEIANIISSIAKVHSGEYVKIILYTAKKKNNYKLAKVISEAWAEKQNHDLEEAKKTVHDRFSDLFNSLYWWKYEWRDLFDVSIRFMNLKKECEKLWEFEIAEKCGKVISDLYKRKTIFDDIKKAISENNPWREDYWPSKDSVNEEKNN